MKSLRPRSMAKTKLIPGFRFHPTDVELVEYFLKRKVIGKKFPLEVIAEVDVYKYAPWDLPDKSLMSTVDLEWYFFCPRAKKYMTGGRMNRSTDVGYWKTTGRDKPIWHNNQSVGLMKVLVFHMGRPPKGHRTDWVMHEFRLHNSKDLAAKDIAQDSYVLCRVFKKDGRGRRNNGGQYSKLLDEENWDDEEDSISIADLEEPLRVLPAIADNNNNLSPCESNWSPTPKSSLSSGATHNPSVVNKDDVVSQTPPEEDDALCLLDCFSEEEIHVLVLSNGDNNIEAGVNSEEKKESEGFPFDDIFRDLEELNNLAELDNEDYGLTKVGFPTNPSHFNC